MRAQSKLHMKGTVMVYHLFRSVTTVKEYGDYQLQVMAEQHKPEGLERVEDRQEASRC